MSGKVQIWLRRDQAEFAISCLKHIINRVDAGASVSGNENIRFACRSTNDRAKEIIEAINASLSKNKA